jgi:hypothetical protein
MTNASVVAIGRGEIVQCRHVVERSCMMDILAQPSAQRHELTSRDLCADSTRKLSVAALCIDKGHDVIDCREYGTTGGI